MDNDVGFENLANAIITQAVMDYRKALTVLEKRPGDEYAQKRCAAFERFFHSEYFQILSNIDPDYLIEQTKKTSYYEIRQQTRSYNQSTATRGSTKKG